MTKRRAGWHQTRHRVAASTGWVCALCGQAVQCAACFPGTDRPATTDHITPRSRGGSSRLRNLQIACLACNRDKADRKHPENLRSER